jgi:hypothetical protein
VKIHTGEFFECFLLSEELVSIFEWLQEHFTQVGHAKIKQDPTKTIWQWECWVDSRVGSGRVRILLTASYVIEGLNANHFPREMFLLTAHQMALLSSGHVWYLSVLMDRKDALLFKTRWV